MIFCVAPEDQGQMVEVAYAAAWGHMVRRTTDRSDGSVSYSIARISKRHDKWAANWCVANGAPPIRRSRWRDVRAEQIMSIFLGSAKDGAQ